MILAVACTVFLSLDTTAVLLTPVVVLLARHIGVPPVPFALTTIWLANTASLMALPALVAVVLPCIVLFLVYRKQLLLHDVSIAPTPPTDTVLFTVSAVVVVALVPAFLYGIPV